MSGSTTPSVSQYLNAANWAYYQSSSVLPPGLTPLLNSGGTQVTAYSYNDGFYAAAFLDAATHQVVITYQGTDTDTGDGTYNFGYLVNQLGADVGLYLGEGAGDAPNQIAALADAKNFVGTVQAALSGTADAGDQIVLTGHSLGASEAEYAAAETGLSGTAFAATGLSTTAVPDGTSSSMGIYVDYGDPVGNYSVQSPDPLGGFVYDDTIRHIGTTTLVPDTLDGLLRGIALNSAATLYTSGTTWSQQLAGATALIGLLATYHPTTNYAADLGVTLVNTDGGSGLSDQVSDPSLLLTIIPALIKLGEAGPIHATGASAIGGLGASEGGATNVAVYDGESPGAALGAPAGYQAAILAGSTSAMFTGDNGTAMALFAGAGADTIQVGAHHDTVYGSSGTLLVQGGSAGLDYHGGLGASTVYAGAGASTLIGGSAQDLLVGSGAGHDVLAAGSGSEALVAGAGDRLFGGGGAALLYGSGGGDSMVTGSGSATLVGGGADTVWAGGGATQMFGAATGSEQVALAGGDTTLVGGGGALDVTLGAGDGSVFAGAGSDLFSFVDGFSSGSLDVIGYDAARDHALFGGYAPGGIQSTAANGNLTLSLAGGGHVTFFGVTSLG
jgi:hypothetical protein